MGVRPSERRSGGDIPSRAGRHKALMAVSHWTGAGWTTVVLDAQAVERLPAIGLSFPGSFIDHPG